MTPRCPECGGTHSPWVRCHEPWSVTPPKSRHECHVNDEENLTLTSDDWAGYGEESHPEPVETSRLWCGHFPEDDCPCGDGSHESPVLTQCESSVPLWKQALWLARNIEEIRSPRPDVVGDDELRGLTLIRVLTIGAEEHGDNVFRLSHQVLAGERKEEWSDAEFYDLVDRFGWQIRDVGAT